MDKLDVAILREFMQAGMILPARLGTGPSYRAIARALQVPFGTVRNRVNAMYSTGALLGSIVFPNPNLLGFKFGAFNMDVPPELEKEEVVRELKLADGVVFLHDFIGRKYSVGFFYETERDLERKLALYGKISGTEGHFGKIPFPPCHSSVSTNDARLIQRLLKKGVGSYSQLARELRVPVRTLKRRMSLLLANRCILSLPNVNYRAIEKGIQADLIIFFRNEAVRSTSEPKILEIVKDYLIFAGLFDVVGVCSLIVPGVGSLTELNRKVREVDGVKEVWAEIVNQYIDQIHLLGEYVVGRTYNSSAQGPLRPEIEGKKRRK